MNKKKIWISSIVALGIILLCGVSVFIYLNQDPFYEYGQDWFDNYSRFPLIKPYEARFWADGGFGWTIHLEGSIYERDFYSYYDVWDVQKIAVEKGVIMIYTPTENPEVDESMGEKMLYWFVIIPDQEIEKAFDQENDFLAYINQWGIQKPAWQEPDDIMTEFRHTKCLHWIPECE
ncbi:MAG: hypothetical protein ISR58_09205 [Anaerolineales bacterium]|nr:hypothetical protein [Chloroflexota bacterium]MBL6981354.1 hypothetical protein [Anaerolineales bacterium]